MSTDVVKLLNKIKNLKEFVVIRDMPESFVFTGTVPFDMKIVGNQGSFKVLASSLEEASEKVDAYLSSHMDE